MKIVDRYLLGEMIGPFTLGVFGFIVFMITDVLFALMDLLVTKSVPLPIFFRLLFFKLPAILVLTFPVSTLFGVTMALGRLSRDNEITVFRTSGISLFRLILPIMIFALVISGATFAFNEKIVPATNHLSENIIREIILKQPLPDVKENVFFRDSFNRYFYIRRVIPRERRLEDLMIYELAGGERLPRVIVARGATFSGSRWVIEEGRIHKFSERGELEYAAAFRTMKINVAENILNFSEQKTPGEMSGRELKDQITMLERSGVETRPLRVEWQLKYSIPLASFIFALIGIPLALPSARAGKMWGPAVSIVLIFIFYFFASMCRSLGKGGVIPPELAAWLPTFTFGILGAILLTRESLFK